MKLNDVFNELGISKVKLAKYLGVSRQMLYNYLALDSINDWPKEKAIKIYSLLDIKEENDLKNIKVNGDFIVSVENRLKNSLNDDNKEQTKVIDIKGLNKKDQELFTNIVNLLTEKINSKDPLEYTTLKYLYYTLLSCDKNKEILYILAYLAKSLRFIKPDEFAYNKDKQLLFESIMYSAMLLYNSGTPSKSKILEKHNKFVKSLEEKNEDFLSRTLELNTAKVQALKELGYTTITEENANEVLDKIVEIESRKV